MQHGPRGLVETSPSVRWIPRADTPLARVVSSQPTRNHTVNGVRLRWKIVPAVALVLEPNCPQASIVPLVLSAPNTSLCQPQLQTTGIAMRTSARSRGFPNREPVDRQLLRIRSTGRHNPLHGLMSDIGDSVEVPVIVQDYQPAALCRGSNDQVADLHRSM